MTSCAQTLRKGKDWITFQTQPTMKQHNINMFSYKRSPRRGKKRKHFINLISLWSITKPQPPQEKIEKEVEERIPWAIQIRNPHSTGSHRGWCDCKAIFFSTSAFTSPVFFYFFLAWRSTHCKEARIFILTPALCVLGLQWIMSINITLPSVGCGVLRSEGRGNDFGVN